MNPAETQQVNEATRELLEARKDHQLATQRDKVAHLREQVVTRLDRLYTTVYDVRSRPEDFPFGAFGQDTDTIDGLLQALAQEYTVLADIEAANAAGEAVLEKFRHLTAVPTPPSSPVEEAVNGQYL
jgi:hypothetical protein